MSFCKSKLSLAANSYGPVQTETMKNRKALFLGCTLSFLVGGGLYAGPYITLYQIYQAVERHDLQGVAAHVNFPELRASVKTNMQKMAQKELANQNPLMGLIGAFIGSFVLDPVVDRIVSPEGVASLLEGQRLQIGNGQQAQFSQKAASVDIDARYESINQFAVEIKPKGDSTSVTLLLSREGLSWMVSGVRLPGS